MTGDVYQKVLGVWSQDINIQGPSGGQWFQGFGAPLTTTGVLNDFYLDTSNGDIYQKQDIAGTPTWVIIGNNYGGGTAVWYNGVGPPAAAIGAVNDYYLDTTASPTAGGLPPGGTLNQALVKVSAADGDVV